jgi:long-subunit acyl-CoA synthetase (AMP-forming)
VDNVLTVDDTIPSRFLETVRGRSDSVAFRSPGGAELTFGAYGDRAARVARGLRELGVGHGDRVVMLIGNRPEFHVADMAVLLLGATPISIYNSSSPEQIRYLAGHARASVAIVEDVGYLERVTAVRDALPDLVHVVLIDGEPGPTDDIVTWDGLLDFDPLDLDVAALTAQPDDLATVIYTSGTTGPPKGVMLDHANICWTVDSIAAALDFSPEGYRIVSYLPMAHIAERLTTHYAGMVFGYEVTTCPDIRQLGATLAAARPQILFGVPRTYEKIHSGIQAALAIDASRAEAFAEALEVGARVADAQARDADIPSALQREFDEVDANVLRPVRQLLGLDAVDVAVTAAAPIPVEILGFFRALGLPLSEMYGLSESSGPLTWEPRRIRLGTVGHAIPGGEVRLAEDHEVLGRGGNIFRGYLDDPERTAEALDADGWLHTGDIGELDADGYLRIVDRKKEIIITAGGKNVSPANAEAALKAQPLIGQVCVVGDGEPFIAALIVLDPDVAPAWAAANGAASTESSALATDPVVLAEVAREVEEANRRFAHSEQIRKFAVLADEWLPDSDELTPTMKLKRHSIATKYAREIADLYR